jgi:hypothetical protein
MPARPSSAVEKPAPASAAALPADRPPAKAPAHVTSAIPGAQPKIGLDGAAVAPTGARPAGAGAPDAGARQGFDVATPPSLPASAPRLNLELVRPRGGELSRSPAAGALRVMPRPPEPAKSKLAEDVEKAQKPDCRNAYSNMGLAAAAPLVRDALTGQGCRW